MFSCYLLSGLFFCDGRWRGNGFGEEKERKSGTSGGRVNCGQDVLYERLIYFWRKKKEEEEVEKEEDKQKYEISAFRKEQWKSEVSMKDRLIKKLTINDIKCDKTHVN